MIIEVLLYVLVLATVVPIGIFLSKLCDDELLKDRFYFRIMSIFLLFTSLILLGVYPKTSIILSLVYMVLLLEVLIYKSKNLKLN